MILIYVVSVLGRHNGNEIATRSQQVVYRPGAGPALGSTINQKKNKKPRTKVQHPLMQGMKKK